MNKAFCLAVQQATALQTFRPRLYVVDSLAMLLYELDIYQGMITVDQADRAAVL